MDKLEAGVEFALAVFPETTALFKPGEGTFDDPTLGHYRKGVEITAFGSERSTGVGVRLMGLT